MRCTQQCEGGSRCFHEQIADDLKDDLEDAEFGIIQASFHRDIEVDLSLSVFKKADGKLHGKFGRFRALHFVSERKLIEKDLVLGFEFAFDDEILQVHVELPLLDRVAHIFPRVGSHGA